MSDSEVIELVEELNNLCSQLSDTLDINCGGCCYVVAILAEGLFNLHIPYKVAITKSCGCRPLEIRKHIRNKEDFYCQHCFIYLHKHKLYINDDGDANYNIKAGCIKYKDLLDYYKATKWNRVYNKKNNKNVANKIGRVFKKYK